MRKHVTKLVVNPNADLGRAWKYAVNLRRIMDKLGDDGAFHELEDIA